MPEFKEIRLLGGLHAMLTETEMNDWISYIKNRVEANKLDETLAEADSIALMVKAKLATTADCKKYAALLLEARKIEDEIFDLSKSWYKKILKKREETTE